MQYEASRLYRICTFISIAGKIYCSQTEIEKSDSLIQVLKTALFERRNCVQEDSIELVKFRWRDSGYLVSGPYFKEDYEVARDVLHKIRLRKYTLDII